MSALYAMRYLGGAGVGFGAMYIGRGTILGADVANGRYKGSYSESNGKLLLDATLHMLTEGVLVTGQRVPAGTEIPLKASWPLNFADGQPQQIEVPGGTVSVTFEKIGDVP